MSACCPRCQKSLEIAQVDTIQVRLCQDCRGVLLAHPDLVQIIEASWCAVSREKAETTSFRVAEGWQNEPSFRCPDCAETMEKYGYMGIGAIQIDRCDTCALVWLDTDELQNMVLALAKTNYRSEDTYHREKEASLDMTTGALLPGAYSSADWLFPDSDGETREVVIVAAKALLGLLLR